jgi:hypothetical protein
LRKQKKKKSREPSIETFEPLILEFIAKHKAILLFIGLSLKAEVVIDY